MVRSSRPSAGLQSQPTRRSSQPAASQQAASYPQSPPIVLHCQHAASQQAATQSHSPPIVRRSQPHSSQQQAVLEFQSHNQRYPTPFGVAYDHFGSYQHVGSPDSTQTDGSWDQPQSPISTFPSEPTQTPAYERSLLPGGFTPTSSEASYNEYDRGLVANDDCLHFPVTRQDFEQHRGITNTSLTHQSYQLQGLATIWSDRRRFIPPDGALRPPLGQQPTRLNPTPPYQEPWNLYQFRHEDPSVNRTVTIPGSREVAGGSAVDSHGGARQRGVRNGPLDSDQRVNARDTRKRGACVRCRLFKEKCDGNAICAGCSHPHRKWKLGCIREWPKDRGYRLLPDQMVQRFRKENYEQFMSMNSYELIGSDEQTFDLRLTINMGRLLQLQVKEVSIFGTRLLERDSFRTVSWTTGDAFYQCVELNSPPISPDFTFKDEKDCENLKHQILTWVEEILQDSNDRTDTFPWHCFWDEEKDQWQRDILVAICEYYDSELDEHHPLKQALSAALLHHLMFKTLEVPADDVQTLFEYIQNPQYREFISGAIPSKIKCSPRAINWFLKVLVYPIMKACVEETLENLQGLLLSDKCNTGVKRDVLFSLAFILLIILGKNQTTIISQAVTALQRKDDGPSLQEAKDLVFAMEREFGDHVIGLCQYWFEPSQKHKADSRASNDADIHSEGFGLLGRVRHITRDAAENFPLITGLQEIDERLFGVTNTKRLLVKLILSIQCLAG